MAKRKLTLSVDAAVLERARRFSRRHRTSLSQLVTTFLSTLDGQPDPASHVVQRLRGVLPSDVSREDHHRHLAKKPPTRLPEEFAQRRSWHPAKPVTHLGSLRGPRPRRTVAWAAGAYLPASPLRRRWTWTTLTIDGRRRLGAFNSAPAVASPRQGRRTR